MAYFPRDENGAFDDRVRLELGGDRVFTSTSYEVSIGVLQQPSRFTVRLGMSGDPRNDYWSAGDFIKRYPPRTPFRLFIGGDYLQQTGFLDNQPRVDRSGSGTVLTLKGRDTLAPLHDGFVKGEFSLRDETFKSLVEKLTQDAWSAHPGEMPKVIAGNAALRKIRAGVPIVDLTPIGTAEQIIERAASGEHTVGAASIVQQTRLGHRYLQVLRTYLDRAGLMVWAAPDGNYVVATPNAKQKPVAKIEVRRGGFLTANATGGAGNVISTAYEIDTLPRYSQIDIYGRGGGKKLGRAKHKGGIVDPEMEAWGFHKPLVIRDANVKNTEQADFLAARKLAEGARHGFSLEYTVSGHTTLSIQGGGRAIWTPDTVVHIVDPDLDIDGEFYLEHVTFSRSPESKTVLRFMRPQDLVFGGEDS